MTRQERSQLACVDVQSILSFLGCNDTSGSPVFEPFRAYQVIGRCGRGKTTRLLALTHHCPKSSYVYLPEDQPCPTIPGGEPVMIDEAQRLPRRVRGRIFRTGVPLVLGTHRNLAWTLRRHGYQVHTERIGKTLSSETLATILNRRIQASSRDPNAPTPRIDFDTASKLIQIFGTDIRAMEGYLYDIVQSQVNQDGEMRFID